MANPPRGKKLDVLIVDDDHASIQVISNILGDGYELRFALSGEEALQRVQEQRPHLMLLDIDMPGMSGLEVAKRLRASPGNAALQILFITSHRTAPMVIEVFQSGGDDYLSKPLSRDRLLAKVHTLTRYLPSQGASMGSPQ